MKVAKIAVMMDQKHARRFWSYGLNIFEAYIAEILAHEGIPYEWIADAEELGDARYDVVIVASVEETEHTASLIWKFAEAGGIVISYAGLNHLKKKLGCTERKLDGEGYASVPDPAFPEAGDLRYLQARPWLPATEEASRAVQTGELHKDRPGGERLGAALLQFGVGRGCIDRWAVNIPYTVVGFQQGTSPAFGDGIPAPDRTADIDDGVIKAEDQCEMDWELDRAVTETGCSYFARPYADLWRRLAVGHLLRRVTDAGFTLPVVGYWPEGIRAVALISHDSDGNRDNDAEKMIEVLQECRVQSTWCVMEPGYGERIYKLVKDNGHELALHYNAFEPDNGLWGETEFRRQLDWIKRAADVTEVTSNKNHYTRFEGWGELFEWCEKTGVACDQTRGPSKQGNVGFLFGTCHPYFPIAWGTQQNRLYDVLEIGFLTQDIELAGLADFSIVQPFLDQVLSVEGVAHFLFHQQYTDDPSVVRALRNVVALAKKQAFVFWTSGRINDWERARRTIKVDRIDETGKALLKGDEKAKGAVVWIPLANHDSTDSVDDQPTEMRFGVRCRKLVFNPELGEPLVCP